MNTHPQGLIQLYQQRLAGLSDLLLSLPGLISEDEAVEQLGKTPGLQKYKIDRVLELCTSVLRDEKEMTIIAVLEVVATMREDRDAKTQNMRTEPTDRARSQHHLTSSRDLPNSQPDYHQQLSRLRTQNQTLQQKLSTLQSQTPHPKTQLELTQLHQLHSYLTNELKKHQLKNTQKQLMVDELEQKLQNLENQNRTSTNTVRKLNGELETLKQLTKEREGDQEVIRNLKNQVQRLNMAVEEQASRNRVELQCMNQTVNRMRITHATEKQTLEREIKLLKQKQSTLIKSFDDKHSEIRKLTQQVKKLTQIEDKLNYQLRVRDQQLIKLQSEVDMKKRELLKMSEIFQDQRRGNMRDVRAIGRKNNAERYNSPRSNNRQNQNTNHSYFMSPQYQRQGARTYSRFRSPRYPQFQQVNQQISRLQTELNTLKTGFSLAKGRSRRSIQQHLSQLRRSLLSLRRNTQKHIKSCQSDCQNLLLNIQNKLHRVLSQQRCDNKQKIQTVKKLCEEQIILMHERNKIELMEKENQIAKFRKELAEKEHRLEAMRVDEKRSREIMENAENLERSYNGLIRQYDELTRKFEQLSVGAAGEKRSKSPPPVIPTPIPKQPQPRSYSKPRPQKDILDKDLILQARLQQLNDKSKDQFGNSTKSKQDILKVDLPRRPYHMPFEMKTNLTNPSVDPIFNRLDEDSQVLDQSRRMNLEDGFNELEDEIEAIIHRRNKRNAKFTK